jgi:hypothetical protein
MDSAQPLGESAANRPVPGDAALRATDADRERAASLLQVATSDGRVSIGEMEERLGLIYAARTKGELASITEDLQPSRHTTARPTVTKDSGWFSSFDRRGRWVVGDHYNGTVVCAVGVIDLREAQFTGAETTIDVNAWNGIVYVVVPDDAEVVVSGTGVMGRFKQDRDSAGQPASIRVNVTGRAVCSTVHVVHQLPPNRARRLQKRDQKRLGR